MATELVTPAPTTVVADDPQKPWKAIAAVAIPILVAVVQLVQIALGDGSWDTNDTINVVLGALGALAVYLVPNPKVIAAQQSDSL